MVLPNQNLDKPGDKQKPSNQLLACKDMKHGEEQGEHCDTQVILG
jgi:hypothetical protein